VIIIKVRVKTFDGYYFESFDRFDDNFCQLLLCYLSISHKIRFEYVFKQWQRLVFNKQNFFVNSRRCL
jgi:regulator of sigma D